ncbi:MAG: IPT/TIG domain-containing protein [Actinomycetota bacterium]|nr:IPT/TIG domain-containing protein [Actinomycetota bacterium]
MAGNNDGRSAELYTPKPRIDGLDPASGAAAGGTSVKITGQGFTHGVTSVLFGSKPATSFTVDSYGQITAVAPSGTESVKISVVNEGGEATSSDSFTYQAAPPDPDPDPGPDPDPDPGPGPSPDPGPAPGSIVAPVADFAQCGLPGAASYLHPAKIRVSRGRVLRSDRRLDVFAPITSRARGADVKVTFQADNRRDTFDAKVSPGGAALDQIRFREPITRGQARLGTGIVNLEYMGDADTRPEFVRLRAASQRAELDVEEISLIGDRLSAEGSVTSRAKGVIRLLYSYVDPDGSPNVHEARAKIQSNGDWKLANDQVPAQLAQCGGYLSIQFTGYFERRIRGEQLAYELNAGQTRRP